jgi:adenylyltransferase/sulfurtransferase
VQEAVKWIHGLPVLAGRGFIFEGLNHTSYVVEYTENANCMSHYVLEPPIGLPFRSGELTLHQLWQQASADFGSDNVVIEFSREIIRDLTCPKCLNSREVYLPVGTLLVDDGVCSQDGSMMGVNTLHGYSGSGDPGGRKLSELGLPLFDVFVARCGTRETSYVIAGDSDEVLSFLAAKEATADVKAKIER